MFTPTATTVSAFKKTKPTAGPTVKMSVFGWTGVQEEGLRISSNITLMSRTLRWGGFTGGEEGFEARGASFYSSHHERLPVDATVRAQKSEV